MKIGIKQFTEEQRVFIRMLKETNFIEKMKNKGYTVLPNYTRGMTEQQLLESGYSWEIGQLIKWLNQWVRDGSYNLGTDTPILNSLAEMYKRYSK